MIEQSGERVQKIILRTKRLNYPWIFFTLESQVVMANSALLLSHSGLGSALSDLRRQETTRLFHFKYTNILSLHKELC